MDDLRQDSQKARLAYQRNTLPCAPSILKHHVSAEVCLLGHQWISRGFTLAQYLEKGSVPSVYVKPKGSLDTDYPRNEGRLANRFFSRNILRMFLWDPTVKRQYPKSPSPKKIRFFFRLGNIFEICFPSSKMTDPRPCPTGWAYLKLCRVQRRHAKLKPTNNKLSAAKIDILGVRETLQDKTPSSQTSIERFSISEKKSICPVSSLNNIRAG